MALYSEIQFSSVCVCGEREHDACWLPSSSCVCRFDVEWVELQNIERIFPRLPSIFLVLWLLCLRQVASTLLYAYVCLCACQTICIYSLIHWRLNFYALVCDTCAYSHAGKFCLRFCLCARRTRWYMLIFIFSEASFSLPFEIRLHCYTSRKSNDDDLMESRRVKMCRISLEK